MASKEQRAEQRRLKRETFGNAIIDAIMKVEADHGMNGDETEAALLQYLAGYADGRLRAFDESDDASNSDKEPELPC